jgi:hypothetical protein
MEEYIKNQCPNCKKCFKHRQGKYKHIKENCKIIQQNEANTLNETLTNRDVSDIKKYLKSMSKQKEDYKTLTLNSITINNNSTTDEEVGYIYVIHVREFLTQNVDVYKFGKTKDIVKRFNQYPKGSNLIFTHKVQRYHEVEKNILKCLRTAQEHGIIFREDLGTEYFEANQETLCTYIGKMIFNHDG